MTVVPAAEPDGWARPRVWAPNAGLVELELPAGPGPGGRAVMSRGRDGWWTSDLTLPHGADYAFALDAQPPVPDPRSPWQPAGVHGPSRTFDPNRFNWSDARWAGLGVSGAVIYELHVGTFTTAGTLAGAVARLDHLVQLGVDLVELMPVAPFNGARGWGYDGVGLCAVHEPYGGPGALQAFVDAAHVRGLGVCLDVVHNHLGPVGNYLSKFGPYFTDAHHTPWGAAVNLDGPGSAEVRRWICDSALRWFRDFHMDALRLDAVHTLVDDSERHVLAQLADEVADLSLELGRPLSLIAESDLNDPVSITPTGEGGWGLQAQWADDVHHAIHALVTGERHGYYVDFGTPDTLAKALTGGFVHDGTWSTFRGQSWGAPLAPRTDARHLVVCASNHDQVGNRALGDRPAAHLDYGSLAIQAALVLLSPFTPMIFMGEEWAASTPWQYFTDHPEPELAKRVRDGRRAEFAGHGWEEIYGSDLQVPDPQDPATFAASRLDWTEALHPKHARLLAWYHQLIRLRRAVADLASGDLAAMNVDFEAARSPCSPAEGGGRCSGRVGWSGWIVVHRGSARIAVNLAEQESVIPCASDGPLTLAAAWTACAVQNSTGASGPTTVTMPPHSVAVLVRAEQPRGG